MKKVLKNIGKIIFVYILSVIILNMLCAILLRKYYSNSAFYEIVINLLSNNSQMSQQNEIYFNLIIILKNLIEGILFAIITSFIFSNILNRQVRIIFPDKLVLRRRTSEGNEGNLTLGILVGNPDEKWLHNVNCSVNCTYMKQVGEIEQRNGENNPNACVGFINNYYRFSFSIRDFPKTFWKHYIEKNEEYVKKDFLLVTITGNIDGLDGKFRVTRKYFIQDIIVDVHEPEKYFKRKVKNMFDSEEKTKIDWKEFPRCIEAGEAQRRDIIDEIINYIK